MFHQNGGHYKYDKLIAKILIVVISIYIMLSIQEAWRNLELKAMFIFSSNGWNFSYYLGN
jgi:hypothetical protein